MTTNSANFIFPSAQPTGGNGCIVPVDDYNSAIETCRAIGATKMLINGKVVSLAARHGDQMIVIFRSDLTPEELCTPNQKGN